MTAKHWRSGLYRLDWALADQHNLLIGPSTRSMVELYGKPSVGKNTLAFYLAGAFDPKGIVPYCALEAYDVGYVKSAVEQGGHTGELILVENQDEKTGEQYSHAERLALLTDYFAQEPGSVAIMDSIGVLRGPAEDGDSRGEGKSLERRTRYTNAYMGARAKMVNAWMRDIDDKLQNRPTPGMVIALNHVYKGGMGERLSPGVVVWTTPGGEGKEFIAAIRIHMWKDKAIEDQVATVSRGVVTKNRFGGSGGQFHIAMITGVGLSPGLTALIDCVELGLAKRSDQVVLLGQNGQPDKKMGKISTWVQAAASRNDAEFEPFYEVLRQTESEMLQVWSAEQEQREMQWRNQQAEAKAPAKKSPRSKKR